MGATAAAGDKVARADGSAKSQLRGSEVRVVQ